MFAQKIAKAKTKTSESPTRIRAPERSSFSLRPFGGATEQTCFLQNTLGNQGALQLLPQPGSPARGQKSGDHNQGGPLEKATSREEEPDVSFGRSQISVFSFDWGNGTLGSHSVPDIIQAKLEVGSVNDPHEEEADQVAARVMMDPAPTGDRAIESGKPAQAKVLGLSIAAFVQRQLVGPDEQQTRDEQQASAGPGQTESDQNQVQSGPDQAPSGEETELAQAKSLSPSSRLHDPAIRDALEARIKSGSGGGTPLAHDVRIFMEPRFGYDFSTVRIHADGESTQMSRTLGAEAFTFGNHIYFGSGNFPSISNLTAHELAHVVQQGGTHKRATSSVGRKCSGCEAEDKLQPKFSADEGVLVQRAGTANADAQGKCLKSVSDSKDSCNDRGTLLCAALGLRVGAINKTAGGSLAAACKVAYGRACKADAERGTAYCNAKRQCLDQGFPDSCPSSPYVIGDPWPG
jgi:hypothetical protein